jgi:hypothetical protein
MTQRGKKHGALKQRRLIVAAIAVALLGLPVAGVAAQDGVIDGLDTFKKSFESFSEEFSGSLPMNSMIGLNWSDAYVGQLFPLPSFGVGVTAGATIMPLAIFDDLTGSLEVGSIENLPGLGIPLPGYAADARVGGIFLPFDIGLKFGTLPELELGDVSAEYTNFGVDLRYAVLDGGILPKLSIGAGYNYLQGAVTTPLGFGETTIASVDLPDNSTANLVLADPVLDFSWEANVFDFKAQLSKSFLIVEPSIGVGASYGTAGTTSGLTTEVSLENAPADVSIDDVESIAGVEVSDQGVSFSSEVQPFEVRAFGGASLNLALFRLDLGLMYNFTSGAYGGTLGARVQL